MTDDTIMIKDHRKMADVRTIQVKVEVCRSSLDISNISIKYFIDLLNYFYKSFVIVLIRELKLRTFEVFGMIFTGRLMA